MQDYINEIEELLGDSKVDRAERLKIIEIAVLMKQTSALEYLGDTLYEIEKQI